MNSKARGARTGRDKGLRFMPSKYNHEQVQTVFWRDGVEGVQEILEQGSVSQFTLRRALRQMKDHHGTEENSASIKGLENMLRELGFLGSGLSSRPDTGDKKQYLVQDADGNPFVRVPVGHMGVQIGDKVTAHFFTDSIKLEPIE